MKKTLIIGSMAALAVTFSACSGSNGEAPKTFDDSLSYYMGQASGQGLFQQISSMPEEDAAKIDKNAFVMGLKTVLDADTSKQDYLIGLQYGLQLVNQLNSYDQAGIKFDRETFFNEFKKAFLADSLPEAEMVKTNDIMQPIMERAMNIMMADRMRKQEAQEKANEEAYQKNKKEGTAFIEKLIKEDKSVKRTESGLAYKVTKMGNGEIAKPGDRVNVIYTGKLIDGTEFDSSKGQEATFPTNAVVKGFGEALTTLPAGTVATLYIPEELGYGRNGQGKIKPGSTLVFEVTIGETVKPVQPTAKPDSVAVAPAKK